MRGTLQGLTEVDPLVTVTSRDGISAFDLISRGTMLEGLRQVRGRSAAVPFALDGRPSEKSVGGRFMRSAQDSSR